MAQQWASESRHGISLHSKCHRIRQVVPGLANIQQLCKAIDEEWTIIPQVTIYKIIFFCIGDVSNTVKLHILEWPFIVASLRHTRAIIMRSNQHLDMPSEVDGLSLQRRSAYSHRFRQICEQYLREIGLFFVHRVQLMKYGGKNKRVAFIILFSVAYTHTHTHI